MSHLNRKTKRAAPTQANSDIKETFHLESLIGKNRSFLEAVRKIPLFASSDATVLLSGETGTGKELFARAIHYHSSRKDKPFIPVNCGALPDHLFENEVFGHARGAYTDAKTRQNGLIAEAEAGTLFLDEIDALSLSAQVKLLRFLQDRRYRLLGSPKSIEADVRIIAATNTDLRQRIAAKLFREDLCHRLNILSLSLPPLRDRMDDIYLLANYFLARFSNQYGRDPIHLSPATLKKLLSYSWPGNIRELEGVIQKAVIMTSSSIIQPEEVTIPLPIHEKKISEKGSLLEAKTHLIKELERTYLTNLMIKHQGNITHASRASGKDRRTLQRLLKKHGINRDSFRGHTDSESSHPESP